MQDNLSHESYQSNLSEAKDPTVPKWLRPHKKYSINLKVVDGQEVVPQWDEFFDERCDHQIPGTENVFRIYFAGCKGPLIFFLHGAGHTSLSWALAASILKKDFCIAAYDCRGHGQTVCPVFDLDSEILVKDGLDILSYSLSHFQTKLGVANLTVIIVGHSFGGAIATGIASSATHFKIRGLVMVDFSEGRALQSINLMEQSVKKFPKNFAQLNDAIAWALKKKILLNIEAAKISIPSQLKREGNAWSSLLLVL